MVAASEIISEHVTGKTLGELHGFDDEQLRSVIEGTVGVFESARKHCLEACFEAIHAAFADYRALQLEEFQGEKALICTCSRKSILNNRLQDSEAVQDAFWVFDTENCVQSG